MEKPRAPYIAKVVFNDDPATVAITKTDNTIINSDTAEALRLFEDAGIVGDKLLLLAEACKRRTDKGHGRVVIVWGNGKPVLLLEEDSTRFDSVRREA
jgi:hypothetical protein